MVFGILFIILIVLAVVGFSKLKPKDAEVFPKKWETLLRSNVRFYIELSQPNKLVFKKRMMLFLSEVHVEGVKTTIEDLDKVLISASAVIPVFGFKEWYYNNLSGIIVYPDTFNHDLEFSDDAEKRQILGMIGTGRFENQMLLSRRALRKAFRNENDKSNTPVHEFVHLVDKMDNETDGIPERIMPREYIKPWLELMHKEIEAINNNQSDIRAYATTNQAEFLAVTSEYFFERPDLFKKNHPKLYHMLSLCFQQSPANKKHNLN